MENPNCTMSLSIMSGKGGVGKSNLTLNTGYALHQAGQKVLLMDCDLGLANLDVLLGMSPERNLQDLMDERVGMEDVLVSIEPGLDFLPATSGVPEMVDLDEDIQVALMAKLQELASGYDSLLLDLGAGISNTVVAFASMAHLKVVVVTPEPTSLTDSYALMKVMRKKRGEERFHVVVNQAADAQEGQRTFDRLSTACSKFLGLDIHYLGHVSHDAALLDAVRRQVPLLKEAAQTPACVDIQALAQTLKTYRHEHYHALSLEKPLRDLPGLALEAEEQRAQ